MQPKDELLKRLAALIPLWAGTLRRQAGASPIDATFVRHYAEVLGSVFVSVDELDSAAKYHEATSGWFPAPADLITIIREARERRAALEAADALSGLIDCVNERGQLCVAKPSRVHDGALLPPGSPPGNGVPCDVFLSFKARGPVALDSGPIMPALPANFNEVVTDLVRAKKII